MASLTIAIQEATKINSQSTLFDLDDYSLDRPTGDYDWENSELDRIYEHPPPSGSAPSGSPTLTPRQDKQPPPDDTQSILKICEWMREQPNGHNLDLPDRAALDLLPILEPPALREHFKNLLPIPGKNREQNREQSKTLLPIPEKNREQNREQSKTLLPIFKPPSKNREQENREQSGTGPTRSNLVETENDRKIVKVNGQTYIFQSTKSLAPINRLNGWLDIKPSPNKRHLYLCLRWREGATQRSKHLGKVVKAA